MNCPQCGGDHYRKDGFLNGRQGYFCKTCQRRYSVVLRAGSGSDEVKQLALKLYLEGMGFRAIGRILGFSNVTILRWIRKFGESAPAVTSDKPVEIMELDEMHTYVASKKTIAGDR
jgi:transposase-like protein